MTAALSLQETSDNLGSETVTVPSDEELRRAAELLSGSTLDLSDPMLGPVARNVAAGVRGRSEAVLIDMARRDLTSSTRPDMF